MIKFNPFAQFLRRFPCWRRIVLGNHRYQRRERLRLFCEAVRREKAR